MPAEAETDPFFELLTDALAGPASPQWRDAVAALREKGAEESNEYQLLISAREDLESGREFRSVRAGTGFTRKLMDGLGEQEKGEGRRHFPVAGFVALVCGLVAVAVVGYVIYRISALSAGPSQVEIDQLAADANHFLAPIATASFNESLPEGWKQIGSLPLSFNGALRPSADALGQGGGVYGSTAIPASTPFLLETTIDASKASDAVWVQAFVSADANFSADRATSAHEVVWSLQGSTQSVVVEGNVNSIAIKPPGGTFPVRIIVNKDIAIVSVGERKPDGKVDYRQVWAGAHHLAAGDRYVGARFLRVKPSGEPSAGVVSIYVVKG